MSRGPEWLKVGCITVLGSGYAPLASGTWGSLVAVIVFLPLWWGAAATGAARVVVEAGIVVGVLLSSWASVAWGCWAIERFGRSDPKQFTLDEFAGQWVALLALPVGLHASISSLLWVVVGQFLVFRVFDIVKPPPARQLERLPGGWGVLADDLFAGAYANVVGQAIWRMTPAAAWLAG